MLTVEGIYKDGKIELAESVSTRNGKVLVTFLGNSDVRLESLGIDENQAMALRHKFSAFTDWDDPSMDLYDDYDNAKAALT